MNIWLAVALAIVIFVIVLGVVAILSWFCIVAYYLPLTSDDNGNTSVLNYAVWQFLRQLASGIYTIPYSILYAGVQVIASIRNNTPALFILGLLSTGGFIWLAFHPEIIQSYLTFTQCSIAPFTNNLVMPILNALRIVWNTLVQIWNWGASIYSFLQYGGFVTLGKCAASQLSFANLVSYIGTFFTTFFADFTRWIGGRPLTDPFDISLSIDALQNIPYAFIPTLDCFCRAFNFLWVYLATLIGMPSVTATLNSAWITVFNVFQIPFGVFMHPNFQPNFTNVTLNSCATVISAGDAVQEAFLLTAELLYGIVTRSEEDLPKAVKDALSVRVMYILTHPLCGAFRLVNMTLIGAVNIKAILATNGSGIAYFQFGQPLDELKVAAEQFGDLIDIIDTAIDDRLRDTGRGPSQGQALVDSSLFALIDILAFLLEWIPGNVFYLTGGGPLPASFGLFNKETPPAGPANFWRYYFVDYWFKAKPFGAPIISPYDGSTITFPIKIGNYTYSSAADSFFKNIWRASQALGDLLGLFNVVVGQVARHLVNIVAAIVLFLGNFISYSFCGLTTICDDMPITARYMDVDTFFNESMFFSAACGDLLRQFDNTSCNSKVLDVNKTFVCQAGEIIETTLDVLILTTKEVVVFAQEVVTLLSGQTKLCLFETTNVSRSKCLKIPDLTTAITELDDGLCAFAYTVTALIPFTNALKCSFKTSSILKENMKTCGYVNTCLGHEFCSILRIIPVVLQIINDLFIKIISGTAFANFETFLSTSVGAIANWFSTCLEQFGLFLDCSLCAVKKAQSGGCTTPVYNLLQPIANAIRDLAKIFSDLFFKLIKIFLLLIIGFFSGNPVTAIIDFIYAFLQNIFVGIGFALVNFIDQLLQKIGLGFLGSFIRILYTGFCTVLEVIINAVIGLLKILSFNNFPYDYVQFCCSDGGCTSHVGSRKRMDTPFIIGNVSYANMDNWLKAIVDADQSVWNASDPCNASITSYAEIPFSTLSTYQFGEVLFCSAKLIWAHRTDNQSTILPLTCDRMILENMNTDWSTFSISDQGTIMECAINRMVTEGIRARLNISWLPQDIATNPLRKAYFGLGLAQGLLLNLQFFNDQTLQPEAILNKNYREFWAKMHVDTSRYENLKTVEDVVRFKEGLHLRSYFELNDATQLDATVYVVTGLWSMTGLLFNGLANMTHAFSDNVTDPGLYLSYDYTQDHPTEAGVSGLLGAISQFFSAVSNLSVHWSDPENYKKRSEAYEVVSEGTFTIYQESVRQVQLIASEYWQTKVYESTHYYNQTCTTGSQECRDSGVTEFREQYEASMRGEDSEHGATSLVFKATQIWNNLDFTTYPIVNPRYKHVQVRQPQPLFYKSEDGSMQPETRLERLSRYVTLVRKGSRASNRRWQIATELYERTRDKVYTNILKRYYKSEYTKDPLALRHHTFMMQQFEKETGIRATTARRQFPKGVKVCPPGEDCVTRYSLDTRLAYDENTLPAMYGVDERDIQRTNPIKIKGNEEFALSLYRAASIIDMPCIKNISFPCSYPLVCEGNATTTLCNQCYYLQAFVDRFIAATDQTITYYEPGGRFTKSLTKAYNAFDYSFDDEATVRVGDSPTLHVALFPSKSRDGSFYDFVVQSARYLGDDTPNKDRLDEFVDRVINAAIRSRESGVQMRESSLFQRLYTDTINGQVFQVVAYVFGPVLEFLYVVVRYFTVEGATKEEKVLEFLAEKFAICDWLEGHDLDGTKKHFSIGELLGLYAIVGLVGNALSYALFGFNPFAVIFTNSVLTMIYVSSFLTLYTNYSYLCAPAVPVNLADDLYDFVAYTLWPKGSYLWGFMFDSFYDNNNAAKCETIKAAKLTHCVHVEGFKDLTYNIAFILDVFFPVFVNDLRSGTGFISRIVMSIPFLKERLDFFKDVDLDDPFIHSRYQGCNWITTLGWNVVIFLLYLTIAGVLAAPVFGVLSTIAEWLWKVATEAAVVIMVVFESVTSNPNFAPRMYDDDDAPDDDDGGGGGGDDDDDDDDGGDEATTTTATSFFSSRYSSFVDHFFPMKKENEPTRKRGKPVIYRKEPNGFNLSRLYNIVTFLKDNLAIGDRKRK